MIARNQLPAALGLADDASVHAIRARAARRASGDRRLGSSDVARTALALQLGLAATASPIAILRVIESVLRPHPLSHRGDLHVGVVDARGAKTH